VSQWNLSQNCWQDETCTAIARIFLQCADQDAHFMNTVITSDESWVCGYGLETKTQSSKWKTPGSPRPKEACQVWSKVKVMLTVFFDDEGIVHHEYAPDGKAVNKEYYIGVLHGLRDAVRHRWPALWKWGDRQLPHDNAPAHSLHLVENFLAKHQIPQVLHSPSSLEMALYDFFLFPKVNMLLKGNRFEDSVEM
jgi:hypothetical protein